jgi:RNA polymerase sigma-70 factor, ECF subfamily
VDRTLVERAMHGDEGAYASLASTAGDRLLAIAYRMLRDLDQAEDAVQVALVGAWRDLPTLREPDHFDAWLTRLLIRACYGEARRQRRWSASIRVIPNDGATSPDMALAVADRDQLERGFRRLPTDQRATGLSINGVLSVSASVSPSYGAVPMMGGTGMPSCIEPVPVPGSGKTILPQPVCPPPY